MSEITFFSPMKEGRPVRLSQSTRAFAKESLAGTYGKEALTHKYAHITLPEGTDPASITDRQKYDLAITAIAEQAPIRLMDGELISGSASLGGAIFHEVPATLDGEHAVCGSISHLTTNFYRVVSEGMDSFRARIEAKQKEPDLTPLQKEVLSSQLNAWNAMKCWHTRYLEALKARMENADSADKKRLSAIYDTLTRVPFGPARTFREGVQSIWFTFSFQRLCGNWPGIGRMDLMLDDLYQADLAAGRITEDDARELLAHFFIKGCEWITLQFRGSGDAQHYQNLVLGGMDETGRDRTGDVTRLMLEVVEELPISDFPIAVRVSEQSPEWLTKKMAEVIRHGSGVVAMYNETLIIDSLVRFGYSLDEARRFANDGCWEIQIPGRTRFIYSPMDLYQVFENQVLCLNEEGAPADYSSFEDLYREFRTAMDRELDGFHKAADNYFYDAPTAVIDLFVDGCIEHAASYYNDGPVYSVFSPHFGGIPDIANAMYAIRKLVYEEKRISFADFMKVLKNNWEGEETLRQYVRNHYTYYGNDNDEVDLIAARIVKDYVSDCRMVKLRNHVWRPPGISTFGRQIEWKDRRAASAHGFRRGDILAGNISPTPSTDRAGATAIIRSACKTDFSDLTCGTVLDIRLDPKSVSGETGVTAIEGLLKAFNALGGFFLQIDVLGKEVLEEARKNPENYQNLAVRISGWSARFVTLDDNWQQMIIERTAQGI